MKDSNNDYELYKKMYLKMFNAITDVLQEQDVEKKDILLRKAQMECEEIFINRKLS